MKSEFDLIARAGRAAAAARPRRPRGQRRRRRRDRARGASVTTVDAMVEGVHFTLRAFGARAVGRKALAAALSDLAAMGAEPGEAYVVARGPGDVDEDELLELARGLAEVAERDGVAVVGGDVTRAPALSLP